jgi:hypothetical protein
MVVHEFDIGRGLLEDEYASVMYSPADRVR